MSSSLDIFRSNTLRNKIYFSTSCEGFTVKKALKKAEFTCMLALVQVRFFGAVRMGYGKAGRQPGPTPNVHRGCGEPFPKFSLNLNWLPTSLRIGLASDGIRGRNMRGCNVYD